MDGQELCGLSNIHKAQEVSSSQGTGSRQASWMCRLSPFVFAQEGVAVWAAVFNIHAVIHTAGNKAASHRAPKNA